MKVFVSFLVVVLLPHVASGHRVGIFADSQGTDCNIVVPYPGGAVVAYVVGTIDATATLGVGAAAFRIAGLPAGWTASAAPGPGVALVLGNPFEEGAFVAYPNCVTGSRVLVTLSITPSSAVSNGSLTILPHTNPQAQQCGFEGSRCDDPCSQFCACNDLGFDCQCAAPLPATINGGPCLVSAAGRTWGGVKATYR
jgi:hypothetical protein